MAPLFAKPKAKSTVPAGERRRCFPDLSAREIRIIRTLDSSGNSHLVYDFLCASRDAEDAVHYDGTLKPEYDAERAEKCGFYRESIAWWQAYWTK